MALLLSSVIATSKKPMRYLNSMGEEQKDVSHLRHYMIEKQHMLLVMSTSKGGK